MTLILPPPVVLYAACCTTNYYNVTNVTTHLYVTYYIQNSLCMSQALVTKKNVSLKYLFFINHDIPIDQYVVEQEELSRLGFLPAHFCQDPFSHQDSTRYCERLREEE